ncbi:MAG: recombination protein O N-terminal domain-containing protein [Minisyncoccia bacterium]|jgi:DNA repair protein RecO (recombination protein O)
MQEYVTEAVVLAKEPLRDFDARYSFFTKRFGKLKGKATSARKITSKLAGHLEPGTLAKVRFVERNGRNGNGVQIADALKYGKLAALLTDLHFLNKMLSEGEPDAALWNELTREHKEERFPWGSALRILGWDPQEAVCEECSKGRKAAAFYIPKQEFFCVVCASKLDRDELLLLDNAEV